MYELDIVADGRDRFDSVLRRLRFHSKTAG